MPGPRRRADDAAVDARPPAPRSRATSRAVAGETALASTNSATRPATCAATSRAACGGQTERTRSLAPASPATVPHVAQPGARRAPRGLGAAALRGPDDVVAGLTQLRAERRAHLPGCSSPTTRHGRCPRISVVPSGRPSTTARAQSRKSPCSTTPGMAHRLTASACRSSTGPSGVSRRRWPSSVTNGSPCVRAEHRGSEHGGDALRRDLPAEPDDLDRQRVAHAEPLGVLLGLRDHHEPAARVAQAPSRGAARRRRPSGAAGRGRSRRSRR